jgi:hypothetical protein
MRITSFVLSSILAGTLGVVLGAAQSYPQAQYPQQSQYPQPQYPPAQAPYPQAGPNYPPANNSQPPLLPPQQLDQLVGPIALYPDGLLAQVLTAATFSNQIPEAAGWANQHAYVTGPALAQAIQQDNLPWDVSVLALLPFPQVLSYMAQNMGWTEQLGDAVLAQRADVMDSVQRLRQEANQNGYLRDPQFTQYERVQEPGPGQIEIIPASPDYYYVPYYNPVVYSRPRPGVYVGGVFHFGGGITLGAAFSPWGWGGGGFGWRDHSILIDRRPWARTWNNRAAYVHPYTTPYRREGPRVEHHEYRPQQFDHGPRGNDRGRDDHRGHDDHHDH